ncbi:MAG: metallophosphoesterase [Candidatus Xenobia bacterium]
MKVPADRLSRQAVGMQPGTGTPETVPELPPVPAGMDTIDLFSFNDLHRKLQPLADGTGGVARLAGQAEALKAQHPNSLVLNLGDVAFDKGPNMGAGTFQPMTPIFNRFVDLIELGNHDLGDPQENYRSLKQELIAPFQGEVLCANARQADDKPIEGTKPYTVKQLAGMNVALIGVVTQDLACNVHPTAAVAVKVFHSLKDLSSAAIPQDDGPRAESIQETLQTLVPQVRQQEKADLVVVMAHESVKDMVRLASHMKGIDVILAAHDHKMTPDPIVVEHDDGSKTLVLEAGGYGRYLAHTRFVVDPAKHQVESVDARLIPIDARSPSDPAVEGIVARHLPA